MNNRRVTVQDVLNLEPCLDDIVVESAFHAGPALLSEIMEWPQFTKEHRIWAVCQLLPEEARTTFAMGCAERAIKAAYTDADAEWKLWADKWLSGEDRSEKEARAAWAAAWAAEAAEAAARAARAAEAAARAAARAAEAAEIDAQFEAIKVLLQK